MGIIDLSRINIKIMYSSAKKQGQQTTLTENSSKRMHSASKSIASYDTFHFNNTKSNLSFRTHKPNANVKISSKEKSTIIPNIFCSFLGLDDKKGEARSFHCQCPKSQDNLCKFVMEWIQQQYEWKTDSQFHKIYQSYNRKKLSEPISANLMFSLQRILNILGMQLDRQWFNTIMEILSNYCKHTEYYNKYSKLIAESDLFIWVCLGITYHLGFDGQITELKKSLIFWATDISMNTFEDLTVYAMQFHHSKVVKMLQSYYGSWLKNMQTKGINIKDISWQWLNEMMFGYMGVQTIGFFLDCFRKAGWPYLYKLILSYFEQRTILIGKKLHVSNNSLTKQELIKLIIDGEQEWPVVFCSASTFSVLQ